MQFLDNCQGNRLQATLGASQPTRWSSESSTSKANPETMKLNSNCFKTDNKTVRSKKVMSLIPAKTGRQALAQTSTAKIPPPLIYMICLKTLTSYYRMTSLALASITVAQ